MMFDEGGSRSSTRNCKAMTSRFGACILISWLDKGYDQRLNCSKQLDPFSCNSPEREVLKGLSTYIVNLICSIQYRRLCRAISQREGGTVGSHCKCRRIINGSRTAEDGFGCLNRIKMKIYWRKAEECREDMTCLKGKRQNIPKWSSGRFTAQKAAASKILRQKLSWTSLQSSASTIANRHNASRT